VYSIVIFHFQLVLVYSWYGFALKTNSIISLFYFFFKISSSYSLYTVIMMMMMIK